MTAQEAAAILSRARWRQCRSWRVDDRGDVRAGIYGPGRYRPDEAIRVAERLQREGRAGS